MDDAAKQDLKKKLKASAKKGYGLTLTLADLISTHHGGPGISVGGNNDDTPPPSNPPTTKPPTKPVNDPNSPYYDDSRDPNRRPGMRPPAKGPKSSKWSDIVQFYFPKPGARYAEGGMVRGCGKAQRGRGKGRMV